MSVQRHGGLETGDVDESRLTRIQAIMSSMTAAERRKPEILNASRKRRIASGSGTTVQDVNRLLKQFRQMQRVMNQLSKGQLPAGLGGRLVR